MASTSSSHTSSATTRRRYLFALAATAIIPRAAAAISQVGCFSSAQPLADQGPYTWQSPSWCTGICSDKGQAVFALSDGSTCWCGDELPPADTQVENSKCNIGCNGYGQDDCGGAGYYSVWLTGLKGDVQHYGGGGGGGGGSSKPSPSPSSGSSSSSTTTKAPTTIVTHIGPGKTITTTFSGAGATASPGSSSSSGSSSKIGVAVGVTVGIVALGAAIGGMYFWLRRRRRHQVEEEYRRQNQVSDFMRGAGDSRPPGSGYSQMSDVRMEPQFGNRRNSVGSIADNQDYSRRILRVANPDSS